MASLQTYTFSQLVTNIATAVQASASALLDFTVGSVLRAIAEATSAVVLWLQAIILQVMTLTRAATSKGTDLDSWVADYGVTRLPAAAATGTVEFERFTPTQQSVISIGATVQSADGTQNFAVTVDTTNTAYSATLGGYVLAANGFAVVVPVQATVPGAGGNVVSEAISVITSPIPGIDTVSNPAGFTNGLDAETDAALRQRFIAYLASLSKATKSAIGYAVLNVQQGLNYTLTENADYNGTTDMGYFYIVVDDGTGHASSDLISSVSNAIETVRPVCSRFGVFAPSLVTANVAMTITSAIGFTHATVVANVVTALTNFINGMKLGTALPYTELAAIAYSVAGVSNATSILLNSSTADVTATNKQRIVAGTMTIA